MSVINYFAIGSMTNPTSLSLRGLTPLESMPAELLEYELQFTGTTSFDHLYYYLLLLYIHAYL
jgi:hypothetical protein